MWKVRTEEAEVRLDMKIQKRAVQGSCVSDAEILKPIFFLRKGTKNSQEQQRTHTHEQNIFVSAR